MPPPPPLSIACGALAAALALPDLAQDAPIIVLMRDELRQCLDEQDTLKARADAVKPRIAKLTAEVDAFKAEEEQLKEEQKRAEDSQALGVRERFERKVKAHTAKGKALEAESAAVRTEGDSLTKDLDAHNSQCANVSVKTEDKEAVMKEREAAGKK